jgi:multidrug transporter EmrE-like cation transporter
MSLYFIALSALCEAIWNIFLTKSKGITDWSNNIVGILFLIISIFAFKKALNGMPLSVASVVWSGLSLIFTIVLDMYFFDTRFDYKIVFFMVLGIISILGLNYYSTMP